jgi:hypothetical protein
MTETYKIFEFMVNKTSREDLILVGERGLLQKNREIVSLN